MKPLSAFARRNTYAASAWALMAVLLVVCAVRAPYLFTSSGLGGLTVSAAPLVLAVMGVTVTALVGSGVDLSAGPLLIFVNVTLVKILFDHQIGAPALVIIWALGVGVAVQVLMAVIITVMRIEPVIVTLSAFLAFAGLDLVILNQPQGEAPRWLSAWGSGQSWLGPMFLLILVACILWLLFTKSPFYTNIRLVGANERTAFVSGVPVTLTRIGAHAISGLFIGAAGLCYTGAIGSGNPTQGGTYTLAVVTALVLGGVSLAGGKGGFLGSVPGAIAVSLISFTLTTFSLGSMASFVVQLAFGIILVLALSAGTLVPRIMARNNARRAS